jgi:hypothetical protein
MKARGNGGMCRQRKQAMIETVEERLAKSPVRALYDVIDAVEELKRRADRIRELESRETITQCPSCGWPRGRSG